MYYKRLRKTLIYNPASSYNLDWILAVGLLIRRLFSFFKLKI